MRLSSCISLDFLYIHNGDEPSEKCIPKVDVVFVVYLFIYLFAHGLLNDSLDSVDYRH